MFADWRSLFYKSLCINDEGGLDFVFQILVDPLIGDLSPCVVHIQAAGGVVGSAVDANGAFHVGVK